MNVQTNDSSELNVTPTTTAGSESALDSDLRAALQRAFEGVEVKNVDSVTEVSHNDDSQGAKPVNNASEGGESEQRPKLESLKDLAETLQIDPKELYSVQVPMANGESLTLGEIKDLASKGNDLELRTVEFEEQRVGAINELQRQNDEFINLVGMLPKEALNPKLIENLRSRRDAHVQEQEVKLIQLIPEWQNDSTREAEVSAINAHLEEYGFSENLFNEVTDHRMKRYLRESWLRDKRMKAALQGVRSRSPSAPSSQRVSSPSKVKSKGNNPKTQRDKIRATFS